jgi:hypothetical protein
MAETKSQPVYQWNTNTKNIRITGYSAEVPLPPGKPPFAVQINNNKLTNSLYGAEHYSRGH